MMEGEENDIKWQYPCVLGCQIIAITTIKVTIFISDESLAENHFKAAEDVLTNYYNNFLKDRLLAKALLLRLLTNC